MMCRSDSGSSPPTPPNRRRHARVAITATRGGTPPSPRWRWPISSTASMARLRAETRARARALQALYAWDLRDGEPLDRIASQVWDDLAIAPDERAFAGRIVRTIIADGKSIDDALRDVTTNWRLERLGAGERA